MRKIEQIFRYILRPDDVTVAYIPKGAKVLSVIGQDGNIVIYLSIDDTSPLEERTFFVVGTGRDYEPDVLEFVGTVQTNVWARNWVWHVFEVKENEEEDYIEVQQTETKALLSGKETENDASPQ